MKIKILSLVILIVINLVAGFKIGSEVGYCELGTSGNCGLGAAYYFILVYILLGSLNCGIFFILNLVKKGQYFIRLIKITLLTGILILIGITIGKYHTWYFSAKVHVALRNSNYLYCKSKEIQMSGFQSYCYKVMGEHGDWIEGCDFAYDSDTCIAKQIIGHDIAICNRLDRTRNRCMEIHKRTYGSTIN